MKRKMREWRHRLKRKVLKPLAWFWYDLRVAVGKFFGKQWDKFTTGWNRRRGRDLLFALPALLVGGGVTVLVAGVLLDSRVELTSYYQLQASRFIQAGNIPAARVACERAAAFGDAGPEDRLRLASIIWVAGDRERATALVRTLAPLGEPTGHAPAHVWLADHLLGQTKTPSRANLDLAERHLLRALQLRPDLVGAHIRLAGLYLQTGRAEQAESHLIAGFDIRPEFGLMLSAIHSARGQKPPARAWAERAAARFAAVLSNDPDNAGARKNLAEARTLLGEFPQAMALLQDGLARHPNDREFRTRIAKTCTAWLDAIPGDGEKEQAQRLLLLETGLRYEPTYLDLLVRLVKLARPEGPSADKPREMLQMLLAKGHASVSLHLALGVDAFERGKTEQARQHLDQAYRLDPNGAVLANNLAWVLAHADPPDLDRALTIMNTVIERRPKDPRFRETRGQILAKQGSWAEAITDLELALPGHANDPALHKTLAEAYRKTGNPDMAAQHQKLAESPPPKP